MCVSMHESVAGQLLFVYFAFCSWLLVACFVAWLCWGDGPEPIHYTYISPLLSERSSRPARGFALMSL